MNTGKVTRARVGVRPHSETVTTPKSVMSRALKAVVAAMLAATMMPSAGIAFAATDSWGGVQR